MWQIFLIAGLVFAALGVVELRKDKKHPSKGLATHKENRLLKNISTPKISLKIPLKKKEKNIEKLPEVNVQGTKYSFKPLNQPQEQEKKVQYIKLKLVEEDELKKKQEQARQRLKILQNMEEEARKKEEMEKFEQMKIENIEREKQKRWKEHYIIKAVKERFGGEEVNENADERKEEGKPGGVFASLLNQREKEVSSESNEASMAEEVIEESTPKYEQYDPLSSLPPQQPQPQEPSLPSLPGAFTQEVESKEEIIEEQSIENKSEEEEEKKEDMLSFFANRARENKKEFDPSDMFSQM